MGDESPYTAPAASVVAGQQALNQPIIFSTKGRIGRLRYLAYSSGLMMLWILLMVIIYSISSAAGISTDYMGMSGNHTAFSVITGVPVGILLIVFTKRRLNDLNRSGWWQLLNIIPLLNILLAIYLIFFPGTLVSNNFGPAPAENSPGVIILGSMALMLVIIMVIVGISGNLFMTFGTPDKGWDALNNEDYETAMKEYKPRAELGDNDAQNSLGVMYSQGWGVKQDSIRALMWFIVAASNGNLEAIDNYSFHEKKMNSAQIAEAQKLARECVARNFKNC
jgi:uncharacterized membrane protein YhaH (DUF805 family)